MIFQKTLELKTEREVELIDITDEVEEVVSESGVKNGICHVFLPHATAALVLNENESGLIEDYEKKFSSLFPRGAGYEHDRIDDNANSHLGSGFVGQERTIPVSDGNLVRGTWQRVLVVELDGPRRRRKVVITVVGE